MLLVQQITTCEINGNAEKIISVKETGKTKKNKLNHHQDYRIPLSNSFETLFIDECQGKPDPTDEGNSMLLSFDHTSSKRRQKKQSTKHPKQAAGYITKNQYEEPLEQKKAHTVPGKRKYAEASKFGKKLCVIDNSGLNKIERICFKKRISFKNRLKRENIL